MLHCLNRSNKRWRRWWHRRRRSAIDDDTKSTAAGRKEKIFLRPWLLSFRRWYENLSFYLLLHAARLLGDLVKVLQGDQSQLAKSIKLLLLDVSFH